MDLFRFDIIFDGLITFCHEKFQTLRRVSNIFFENFDTTSEFLYEFLVGPTANSKFSKMAVVAFCNETPQKILFSITQP